LQQLLLGGLDCLVEHVAVITGCQATITCGLAGWHAVLHEQICARVKMRAS